MAYKNNIKLSHVNVGYRNELESLVVDKAPAGKEFDVSLC